VSKTKIFIGATVCAALLGLCFMGISTNAVYFYTPKEALSKANEIKNNIIKLGGMVKEGSILREEFGKKISFVVSDMKGSEIKINYQGSPPDLFKENAGVVIEGRMTAQKTFTAHLIMAKHSEEYRVPDDPHSFNQALLEKSILKNEEKI
jgi:cytochrome c-type biogenesis protein CcmE